MRPTPREELEGVRRILADTVAPAVSGEYAEAQLAQAINALERLIPMVETALPRLAAENRSLDRLFLRLREELASIQGAGALFERRDNPQQAADAEAEIFQEVHGRNTQLRDRLSATITFLETAEQSDHITTARNLVRTTMRANLDDALTSKED